MFVTAKLVVGAGIRFKNTGEIYHVCQEHVVFVGDAQQVIAGPHKDFDEDVYTVELLQPMATQKLPFFNSGNGCAMEYITIHITDSCNTRNPDVSISALPA